MLTLHKQRDDNPADFRRMRSYRSPSPIASGSRTIELEDGGALSNLFRPSTSRSASGSSIASNDIHIGPPPQLPLPPDHSVLMPGFLLSEAPICAASVDDILRWRSALQEVVPHLYGRGFVLEGDNVLVMAQCLLQYIHHQTENDASASDLLRRPRPWVLPVGITTCIPSANSSNSFRSLLQRHRTYQAFVIFLHHLFNF